MPPKAKDESAQHIVRLKVIVRRLPPHLPEEIFWKSVEPWVNDNSVSYKIYHPGKLRTQKISTPSRAYIVFKDEGKIADFSRDYDGHIFKDKQGRESYAVVEFAPFQKVPPPPERVKADARLGTIEKDEDYIAFIGSLKEPKERPPDPTETPAPAPEPKLTPLLEALVAEKTILKAKESQGGRHLQPPGGAKASGSKDDLAAKKGQQAAGPSAPRDTDTEKDKGDPKSKRAAKKNKGGKGPQGAPGAQPATNVAASPPKISVLKPPKPHASTSSNPPPAPQQQQSQPSKPPLQEAGTSTSKQRPAPGAGKAGPGPSRKEKEKDSTAPQATPGSRRDKGKEPAQPPSKDDNPTTASPRPRKAEARPQPTPATPTTDTADATTEAAPPKRRGRPIIGLASRQLQSALNQAGVPARPKRKDDTAKATANDAGGA